MLHAVTDTFPSQCMRVDGRMTPCGPGNEQCGRPFGSGSPNFHIHDPSCDENDPNGPFYDDVHGMYHLFFQDHLAMQGGGGPVWGHVVSRDLAHWARLPVALWNDHDYDNSAVFTGSTTIVEGRPKIVYPGICKQGPGCLTGITFAVAEPSNLSDPFYTDWSKAARNPIVNTSDWDPSTAWRTQHGEWRFLAASSGNLPMYASPDFIHWHKLGNTAFAADDCCPSLFPVPLRSQGEGRVAALGPTHMLKSHDRLYLGSWMDGESGDVGKWSTTPGVSSAGLLFDIGKHFGASKDFWDPVMQRRIMWGWATVPPSSVQALPRSITWDPELDQLYSAPLQEQDLLRESLLAEMHGLELQAGQPMRLGIWPGSVGNQSEVKALFTIPKRAARVGVIVMSGAEASTSGRLFYVDYVPPHPSVAHLPYSLAAGAIDLTPYARVMPQKDLPGGDYNITIVSYLDFSLCQTSCDEDKKCQAWTYTIRGDPPLSSDRSCCLKGEVPSPEPAKINNPLTVSGVKYPHAPHTRKGTSGVFKMSPQDKTLSIRVYVDNTFSEGFWQDGRMAVTVITPPTVEASMFLTSDADVMVESVQAWRVGSIYVSKEQILATPRAGYPTLSV